MDFISIDFETANSYRGSACALGVVEYQNNQKVREWKWLIKPRDLRFDDFNSQLHGITQDDVINEPEFDVIYNNELKEILDGKLAISHYASFDLSVLRLLTEDYNLEPPNLECLCTYEYSKRALKQLSSYSLYSLASSLDVNYNMSDTLSSATACANAFIKINNINDVISKEDIFNKMFLKSYIVNSSGFHGKNLLVQGSAVENPESPFYQKEVVFTGKIEAMSRSEALQVVKNIGGIPGKGVTLNTNFLVVGGYDSIRYGFDHKSTKILKAEKYIQNGQEIELLNEEDFMRMI